MSAFDRRLRLPRVWCGCGVGAVLIELLPKFVYIFPEKAIPDPGLASITYRSAFVMASRVRGGGVQGERC